MYVNEHFKRLLGLDAGDDARSIYVDPLDRQRIMRALDANLPVVNEDLQVYDAGGRIIDLLATYHRLDYDGEPSIIAYQVDVTALKQAERDLKGLSDRLQLATRSAQIGIWEWDIKNDEVKWDEVMHRQFQVTEQEIAIDFNAWQSRVHPQDRQRVDDALRDALRTGTPIKTEYRVIRPDGTLRHFSANAITESDDSGRRVRLVGTNVDVTHARVAADYLREAKEAAERATRAKTQFLANMSHEIRTPMNAVLGYANLLMRDNSLTEAHRRKVAVINSSGNHLLSLIDEILEMSRIEAGQVTISAKPLNLRELFGEIDALFAQSAKAAGIRWLVSVDDGVPGTVIGDGVKIRQVLVNLVGNAIKFTDSGFVHLRTAASASRPDGVRVGASVEDTGKGIEPNELETIFSPFSRLDPESTGGTGLGLSISRSFANLMGGDIKVESEPGRGSVFTFSFRVEPVEHDEIQSGTENTATPGIGFSEFSSAGKRPKALIVDDIATNRELLVDMMRAIGFETVTAENGEEAIALHERHQPGLIMMDLRMPVMDGMEATRRIRALGSSACVIAISASADASTERDARAAGADDFVRKPFREDDLLARVRRGLSDRR